MTVPRPLCHTDQRVFPGQLDHGLVGFRPGLPNITLDIPVRTHSLWATLGIRLGVNRLEICPSLAAWVKRPPPTRIAIPARHTPMPAERSHIYSFPSTAQTSSLPFSVVNGHLEAAIGVHHYTARPEP